MSHKIFNFVLCITLLASLIGLIPTTVVQAATPQPETTSYPYATDHLIVKLRAEARVEKGTTSTHIASLDRALAEMNATALEAVPGLPATYRVKLDSKSVDIPAAVKALNGDPAVEYAEPDYLAKFASAPDDPRYSEQWGLTKVQAEGAWDLTMGSPNVVIAIIDSGIDLAHEDLSPNLWVNPGEVAGNSLDDDNNGFVDDVQGWNFVNGTNDVSDFIGHGSLVAGVAAAKTNNTLGIAGMCGNCRIMPVKITQVSGFANYSDIAAGVNYAVDKGAKVINLSVGGYADSITVKNAINNALSKNIVVVGGVGNDNKSDPFYPAAYEGVIAVAGTDESDVRVTSSNYGTWVDISAPGQNILSTTLGDYSSDNGTSYAAPFVSGAAGLLLSLHPEWPNNMVLTQLTHTADNVESLNPGYEGLLGAGRLNAGIASSTQPLSELTIASIRVNGDLAGRPETGAEAAVSITLKNTWAGALGVSAELSSSDPVVTVTSSISQFGDMDSGESATSWQDYLIDVAANAGYSHEIYLVLHVSANNGEYLLDLPFSIITCSSEESVSGTISADTIWNNDKSYYVNDNLIIAQEATLIIQPGTHVKVAEGKWIRVDGGLIADGFTDQPIIFSSYDPNLTWNGIRFAYSSIQAVFDDYGNYISGNIMRNVWVSNATVGVYLQKAPYFEQCKFQNNTTAININALSPRIENCDFLNNSGVIEMSGGQPTIRNSRFVGNGSVIYGSGSPIIIGNTLSYNTGSVINLTGGATGTTIIKYNDIFNNGGFAVATGNCCAYTRNLVFRNNRIVLNGGGVRFAHVYNPIIIYNLIAGNGATGMYGDTSGFSIAILQSDIPTIDPETPDLTLEGIQFNTIINNAGAGLDIADSYTDACVISNNNLLGNGGYDLYTRTYSGDVLTLGENYWGTVVTNEILERIYDCNDSEYGCNNPEAITGEVILGPALPDPSANAPGFVRAVSVSPNPVGIESANFVITFSRPMDITINPQLFFQYKPENIVTGDNASNSGLSNEMHAITIDTDDTKRYNTTSDAFELLLNSPAYPIQDSPTWLDETHFQISYGFTSLIPRGDYILNISDAKDSDGLKIVPDASTTFSVDYAGEISDTTPPAAPLVSAWGNGSLTQLSGQATASDPDSEIVGYRYAIGSTPGGSDVVNWTNTPYTEITRTGLLLQPDQPYYVSFQARNLGGLWSPIGSSNPVVNGQMPIPTPTLASLNPASAVAGSAAFTLTVTGTNFVSNSVVRWNGSDRATTFVSATQLTAQILTADIATAGDYPVTVFTPAPGGGTSNAVNFNVAVPNSPPVAVDDSYTTDEDTELNMDTPGLLGNDTDADSNPLTAVKVTDPAHGTLILNANGSFTYTPDGNWYGTDSFTYKANDGTADSNAATVTLTVTALNDVPVANAQSVSTTEDTAKAITLTATDPDDTTFTWTIVATPSHGSLSGTAPNVTYTPAANYSGADSFTFKVNDGDVDSNIATVTLTVTALNDLPVAVDDSYTTDEDTELIIAAPGVLGNDTDADSNPLTAILVTGPVHGTLTLNADGSFTYTPDSNWYGSETFTYKANDGIADSNAATVTITVADVPETRHIYLPLIYK